MEFFADRFHYGHVEIVVWMLHDFEESGEAEFATTVFRRAGSLTFQATWQFCFGFKGRNAFELDFVLPIVITIVFVLEGEGVAIFRQELAETDVFYSAFLKPVFTFRITFVLVIHQLGINVLKTDDGELIIMTILPPHCVLDVRMEFVERAVSDLNSSPDGGHDSKQSNLELIDSLCKFWLSGCFACRRIRKDVGHQAATKLHRDFCQNRSQGFGSFGHGSGQTLQDSGDLSRREANAHCLQLFLQLRWYSRNLGSSGAVGVIEGEVINWLMIIPELFG